MTAPSEVDVLKLVSRVAIAVLLVAGVWVVVERSDLPFPGLSSPTQIAVDAAGQPPWTVEGYGWRYSVASVARTTSEWEFKKRRSITIVAYVERTERSSHTAMQYRFSDQNSGSALEPVPFKGAGDDNPPLRQRSKLVHVVWDVEPRTTMLTVVLHDFFWPDGRDLVIRNVPVPSR